MEELPLPLSFYVDRASTFTHRGCKLSDMLDLGSKVTFSGVLGVLLSLYFRSMKTNATLASYKANLIAMQLLGPCPKARNAYLQLGLCQCA